MEPFLLDPAFKTVIWLLIGFFLVSAVLGAFSRSGGSVLRLAYWVRWLLGIRVFGGARWARKSELRREGMATPGGLFLGNMRGLDLYHSGEGHLFTIGGTGGGKSSGLVVPTLCELREGSIVVTDPSGELCAMTARRRAEIGPVVYLNPFGSVFEADTNLIYPDTGFNPFSVLDPASPNFIADVRALSRLLMVTDRRESGSYFNDEGAEFLYLMIASIMLFEDDDLKNLAFLFELLRDEQYEMLNRLDTLKKNRTHPAVAHDATRFADMIRNAPEQWTGVISKAAQATSRYPPQTPLGIHTAKDGFDLARLKRERCTVFLLVPTSMLPTALPWLNLVVGLVGNAVAKPGPRAPVTLLLDETPALGFLPDLRAVMAQNRKAGLRAWIFTQTYSALSGMYGPDGVKELMGLCLIKQFFALDEPEVQELVSKMAGQKSVANPSAGGSMGDVGQPLIRPDEVRGLPKWHQIIFRGGFQYPIRARLVPFFKRREWAALVDKNPYRTD